MLETSITETQVQVQLMAEKGNASKVVINNYTPYRWRENDVFQVTKAGYWVEYEIKRSVEDYRADFRKMIGPRSKHDFIAKGFDGVGRETPNRFYFVVPEPMVDKIELPEYAGLLAFRGSSWGVCLRTIKLAPLLHRTKFDRIEYGAQVTAYHRWRYAYLQKEGNLHG